jgi:hypothetical protein
MLIDSLEGPQNMPLRLKQYHALYNVPYAPVAAELGVSTPTYHRIVTDKISPRIDLVEQLEKITDGFVKAQHFYKSNADQVRIGVDYE